MKIRRRASARSTPPLGPTVKFTSFHHAAGTRGMGTPRRAGPRHLWVFRLQQRRVQLRSHSARATAVFAAMAVRRRIWLRQLCLAYPMERCNANLVYLRQIYFVARIAGVVAAVRRRRCPWDQWRRRNDIAASASRHASSCAAGCCCCNGRTDRGRRRWGKILVMVVVQREAY